MVEVGEPTQISTLTRTLGTARTRGTAAAAMQQYRIMYSQYRANSVLLILIRSCTNCTLGTARTRGTAEAAMQQYRIMYSRYRVNNTLLVLIR